MDPIDSLQSRASKKMDAIDSFLSRGSKKVDPTQVDQQTGPEWSLAFLREHQAHLRRHTYVSCNLSEISDQTEQTDFPDSRHSSLNAEPLTLDAEAIHEAKDQAVDVLQTIDPEEAWDVFTKDAEVQTEDASPQDGQAEILAQQLHALLEQAQQVAEANGEQSRVGDKKSGVADKKGEVVTETLPHDRADVDVNAAHTAESLPKGDGKKQND